MNLRVKSETFHTAAGSDTPNTLHQTEPTAVPLALCERLKYYVLLLPFVALK